MLSVPMRPMPMKATRMRSLAPRTLPVKMEVASAAPVAFRKSLRSVMNQPFVAQAFLPVRIYSDAIAQASMAVAQTTLPNHEVDQLVWHFDDFNDLLTLEVRLNLRIGSRAFDDNIWVCSERRPMMTAYSAAHLHHPLSKIFFRQRAIVRRPFMLEYRPAPAEFFPQFLRQIRRKRSE